MDVSSVIKAARLAKGLTQQELGEIVGVQKSAIAKYESGRIVNIKRSTLQKLAKALGLRVIDLIEFEETPKEIADFLLISRGCNWTISVEVVLLLLLFSL